MMWLYWAIRRELEHRRRTAGAMRQMRRYGYTAEWHGLINKRRNWNKYAA